MFLICKPRHSNTFSVLICGISATVFHPRIIRILILFLFQGCFLLTHATEVIFQVNDQNGDPIAGSQIYINSTRALITAGQAVNLTPGSYSVQVKPGMLGKPQVQYQMLYRLEEFEVSGNNQTLTFIWEMASFQLQLVDEKGVPIPASHFYQSAQRMYVEMDAVYELPITTGSAYGQIEGPFAQGYPFAARPGIVGVRQTGSLFWNEDPIPLTSAGVNEKLVWQTADLELKVVDQDGDMIPNSVFYNPNLRFYIENGQSLRLPVTKDIPGLSIGGFFAREGYVFTILPGLAGQRQPAPLLAKNDFTAPLSAGGNSYSYEWEVGKGRLYIVKNQEEELCDGVVLLFRQQINSGDLVVLPRTDIAGAQGVYNDGYDLRFRPALRRPFSGFYVFELFSGGVFSPTAAPLGDFNIGLQFETPQDPCLRPVSLACDDDLRLRPGENCQTELKPEMVLNGQLGNLTYDDFQVTVADSLPANAAIIDGLGTYRYHVSLRDPPPPGVDFTDCWGFVRVESAGPPKAVCKDITVEMGENESAYILPEEVYDASASDNCGPLSLSLDRQRITCEELIGAADSAGCDLQLDGKSTYLLVPDTSTMASLDQLTFSAWIELDENAPNSGYAAIGVKRNPQGGSATDIFGLWIRLTDHKLYTEYNGSAINGPNQHLAGGTIIPGKRHLVALVVSNTAPYVEIFLDGQSVGSANIDPGVINTAGAPLNLGRYQEISPQYFPGRLSNVQLWRGPWSGPDIIILSQDGGPGLNAGLLGYWPFRGASKDENCLWDKSGNGLHASLYGAEGENIGAEPGGVKQLSAPIPVTLTVTRADGKTSSCQANVSLIDKIPPHMQCCPVYLEGNLQDINYCPGETFQLQINGPGFYKWVPAEGLSCSDCPNPVLSGNVQTEYTVYGYASQEDFDQGLSCGSMSLLINHKSECGRSDIIGCCFSNYGAGVYVGPDTYLNVYCNLVNEAVVANNTLKGGLFENHRSIRVFLDWINNGYNNLFSNQKAQSELFGANQRMGGLAPTHFYDLLLSGNGRKEMWVDEYAFHELDLTDQELATSKHVFYVENNDPNAIKRNLGFVSTDGTGSYLSRKMRSAGGAFYLFPMGSAKNTFRYRPFALGEIAVEDTYQVRFQNNNPGLDNLIGKAPNVKSLNALFYHKIRTNTTIKEEKVLRMRSWFNKASDGEFQSLAHWDAAPTPWWRKAPGGTLTDLSPDLSYVETRLDLHDFTGESYALSQAGIYINTGNFGNTDQQDGGNVNIVVEGNSNQQGGGLGDPNQTGGNTSITPSPVEGDYTIQVTTGDCAVPGAITFSVQNNGNITDVNYQSLENADHQGALAADLFEVDNLNSGLILKDTPPVFSCANLINIRFGPSEPWVLSDNEPQEMLVTGVPAAVKVVELKIYDKNDASQCTKSLNENGKFPISVQSCNLKNGPHRFTLKIDSGEIIQGYFIKKP